MKLITNMISTKTTKVTLSDLLKSAKTQAALTKTASKKPEPKPVSKVAEKKDGCETSGQLEPKANPNNDPKVVDQKAPAAKGKVESDKEGKDSGQPKAEAKLVNTPKVVEQSSHVWVKISKLTDTQKARLRKVWSVFWTPDFIGALLADQ
jgi:DNA-directed RNA polymerase subunit M/transcription elongation factor TFIIS